MEESCYNSYLIRFYMSERRPTPHKLANYFKYFGSREQIAKIEYNTDIFTPFIVYWIDILSFFNNFKNITLFKKKIITSYFRKYHIHLFSKSLFLPWKYETIADRQSNTSLFIDANVQTILKSSECNIPYNGSFTDKAYVTRPRRIRAGAGDGIAPPAIFPTTWCRIKL